MKGRWSGGVPMRNAQGGWVSIALPAAQAGISALSGNSQRSRDRRDIQAARAAEGQREADVSAATQRIDQMFDSGARQNQYSQYLNALRQHYTGDVNRQKQVADRNLRFGMARAGLTGGSASVDAGRTMGEEYLRALMGAERAAQGSVSDLRSADEQQRLSLIDLARGGMDATTASQRAMRGMDMNITGARANAKQRNLGDMFAATTDTARRQREAAEHRRYFGYDAHRSDVYGGGGGFAATGGRF